MAQNLSKREQRRVRQRRQQTKGNLIWGGLGLGVLVIIGFFILQGARPRAGKEIPIMLTSHVPVDSDPGTYNSNPPTSGPHYPEEERPGFYDTNTYQYPAGYLVHNLEHGCVIFWYNCASLGETACADLKAQINSVMDEFRGVKVIAYPWDSMEVPLAMTSWGRLLKMDGFDAVKARAFYKTNLRKSPEPDAP